MLPITFPEANIILNKPAEMTDEQCMSISACITKDQDGFPLIVTCWQLSKEDLEDIQKEGKIYLMVYGNSTPPVNLQTYTPFSENV